MTASFFVLALTSAALAAEPQRAESDPNNLSAAILGGAALGLGTPLWAGGELEYERRFLGQGLFGVSGRLNLGNDELGSPLGGWRLGAHLGVECSRSRRVSYQWLLRAGVTTLAWIPAPSLGLQNEVSFAPVLLDHFRWRVGLASAAEFPWRLSGELWSEVAVLSGSLSVGARVVAGAHVGVDLVGAGAGVRLQVERSF